MWLYEWQCVKLRCVNNSTLFHLFVQSIERRRPLGQRVAQCSLPSQTFARPSLQYCWSLHVVWTIVMRHITHSTFFSIKNVRKVEKHHSDNFSTHRNSDNSTTPNKSDDKIKQIMKRILCTQLEYWKIHSLNWNNFCNNLKV